MNICRLELVGGGLDSMLSFMTLVVHPVFFVISSCDLIAEQVHIQSSSVKLACCGIGFEECNFDQNTRMWPHRRM